MRKRLIKLEPAHVSNITMYSSASSCVVQDIPEFYSLDEPSLKPFLDLWTKYHDRDAKSLEEFQTFSFSVGIEFERMLNRVLGRWRTFNKDKRVIHDLLLQFQDLFVEKQNNPSTVFRLRSRMGFVLASSS